MKLIITTCDQYMHLVSVCCHRINKFWPGQDIHVLCFETMPNLPKNVTQHSLGKQEDFGNLWTDPLIPWFDKFEDEYFILMLDDYHITAKPDPMMDELSWTDTLDKFDLSNDRANFPHISITPWLIESEQTARYRTSLQAAIWKTSYFRKFLVPGRTIWEFELLGEEEAMNDGGLIMGTREGLLKYKNVMLAGRKR